MAEFEKKTRFQKAILELRRLIFSGEAEAGERLSEVALSERVGISRTPLREAMARLVEEGLLERLATGGYRVRMLQPGDVVDSIELRGVIEGMAVRIAAERGCDDAQLRECRVILDGIDEALGTRPETSDFDRYVELNAEFHLCLARLARSNVIEMEVRRVSNLPLASPSAFLEGQADVAAFRRSLFGAQEQHRAIVEAVEHREGARAEAVAREHARLARRNLAYIMRAENRLKDRVPGLALVST